MTSTRNTPVSFLHLSDIHFFKRSNGVFDLDKDFRSQLEKDVQQLCGDGFGPIHGILITGDIAYSGKPEEYEAALEWLGTLCDSLGISRDQVWMTPGNHDVCRDTVRQSKILSTLHQTLRAARTDTLDNELCTTFEDKDYRQFIFKPIKEYVSFASKFGCEITPEAPFWQSSVPLNDGSILRLHGLNSTMISDDQDNQDGTNLILGSYQALLPDEPGVTYMTLCHHPVHVLRDASIVENILNVRAQVQLFGHRHYQDVRHVMNKAGTDTLRVFSGSLHPERPGQYIPRFNLLSLSVEGTGSDRTLLVDLWPRKWNSDSFTFQGDLSEDGCQCHDYRLKLKPWTSEAEQDVPAADGATPPTKDAVPLDKHTEGAQLYTGGAVVDPARELTFRFLTLQHHQIVRIAAELELITADDEHLYDFELFKRIFERAKEQNRLAELWEAVDRQHGDEADRVNPYKESMS